MTMTKTDLQSRIGDGRFGGCDREEIAQLVEWMLDEYSLSELESMVSMHDDTMLSVAAIVAAEGSQLGADLVASQDHGWPLQVQALEDHLRALRDEDEDEDED